MHAVRWATLVLLAIAIAAFARFWIARQEAAALRAEIAYQKQQHGRLAALRSEHDRLRAEKVSDEELARLRNDHAALVRLRGEITRLEETAEQKERALKERPAPLPALRLDLGLAADNGLLVDGVSAKPEALRELLTRFAERSESVDIRFRYDPADGRIALVKETVDGISQLARQLKLRMTLRLERVPAAQHPTGETAAR